MSDIAKQKADWLIDAVACATQDRSLLRDDPAANYVLIEAIMANGEKAVETAIASLTEEVERLKKDREEILLEVFGGEDAPGAASHFGLNGVKETMAWHKSVILELEAAEATIERLETALKPFAEAADSLNDDHRDRSDIWESPAAMCITAGNLRAARAALQSTEQRT